MTNRREFLQTGAVSAIAANGLITRWAEAVGAAAPAALGRALYDDRYAAARRFAAAMGAQGVATSALDGGDVTRFYLELEQLWRRSSIAVAGFTQFGPMLVVERLGLERGMRLAMRTELPTAELEPPTVPASTEPPLIHYYTPQAEQQGYGPALNGLLYSWVVAPRAERG